MRSFILIFFCYFSLSAQVTDGGDKLVSEVVFSGSRQSEVLPLISGRGLIFTNSISINGTPAGVFIIDTGSNVSIIDKSKLAEFGLHETFQGLSEVTDLRKFRFYRVKEFQMGRVSIKNHFIYSGRVTAHYPKFKEPVIGVLGGDILSKLPFKLDLNNFTLSFYKPAAFKPKGKPHPLNISNKLLNLDFFSKANPHAGVPLVSAKINDTISEELMIDSTEPDAVILRSDKAAKHRTLAGSYKIPLILRKSGSSVLQYNALVKNLAIANEKLDIKNKFSCILLPRQGFIAEESQMGSAILQNSLLSCDYANGKYWFEKAATPAKYRQKNDFAGHTPLARAVRNGDAATVQELLKDDKNLNFDGIKGETLLMLAVEGKNSAIMDMLVKTSPLSVNIYNHGGITALMRAAAANEVLMVDTLINNKAQIERADVDGMTALHYSVLGGSLVVMDKLLRNKAKINSQMKNGMRALSLAAGEGNKQLFNALLEAGAELSYIDKQGRTLLHLAAFGNRPDILEIVLKVKNSPDINAPSTDGMTPLMVAVKHLRIETAKSLIKHGASVKAMNSKNFTTALDLAYKTKNQALIDIIQDAWSK